jgi:hypothetical protein
MDLASLAQLTGHVVRMDDKLPWEADPLRQTRALIALGQKKESCDYFATSIAAARSLNSQLLVKEGQDVYQQLLARWHNERQVMELADLFLA